MNDMSPNSAEGPNAVKIAGAFAETLITRWQVLLILTGLAWGAGGLARALQNLIFGFDSEPFMEVIGLDVVPTAFFAAAAAHAVLWDWRPTVRESLNVASRAFVTMLIVLVVFRLAFMLGLLFLIIPGLIILFVFTLAPIFVMAERPGIVQCFVRSWDVMRRHVPAMLGGYMVFFLACVGILVVTGIVAAIATAGLSETASGMVAGSLVAAVLSILHVSFAASAFRELVPLQD